MQVRTATHQSCRMNFSSLGGPDPCSRVCASLHVENVMKRGSAEFRLSETPRFLSAPKENRTVEKYSVTGLGCAENK